MIADLQAHQSALEARGLRPSRIRMHPADLTDYLDEVGAAGTGRIAFVAKSPAEDVYQLFPPRSGIGVGFNGLPVVVDATVPRGTPVFEVGAAAEPPADDTPIVAESVRREMARIGKDLADTIVRAGPSTDGPIRVVAGVSNSVMRSLGARPRGWRVTLTFERQDIPE